MPRKKVPAATPRPPTSPCLTGRRWKVRVIPGPRPPPAPRQAGAHYVPVAPPWADHRPGDPGPAHTTPASQASPQSSPHPSLAPQGGNVVTACFTVTDTHKPSAGALSGQDTAREDPMPRERSGQMQSPGSAQIRDGPLGSNPTPSARPRGTGPDLESPWVRIPRPPLDLGKPVLTWVYPREAHVLASSLTAARCSQLLPSVPARVGARVGRSPRPSSQPPIRGPRPRLLRKLRVSVVADAARMQSHSGLVE